MRSSRLHSAHVLAVLASFFCFVFFLAHPPTIAAQSGNAQIKGTVLGGPISGIQVTALEVDADYPFYGEVLGNTYYIKGLPAGNYNIVVSAGPQWISVPSSANFTVPQSQGIYTGPTFTLVPAAGTISGQINYLNPALCAQDYNSVEATVQLYKLINSNWTPVQTTDSIVPDRGIGGVYDFTGVTPGTYLIIVSSSNFQADSIVVTMGYSNLVNQNLSVWRTTYNICGNVWQPNGQGAPGTVYAFFTGTNGRVVSTTVQQDGTYIIPNLPPNDWGVFMVSSPNWTYTPAWPNFQPVYLSDDAINVNFTGTQANYSLYGDFTGLPYGYPETLYLFNAQNQLVQTTPARYLQQWVFNNVAPGNYSIWVSKPPSYTIITPKAKTVTVAGNTYAGAFTLVGANYGSMSGIAFSYPQPGGPSGYYDPYMAITSTDYFNDDYTQYVLGSGFINWYTIKSPYSFKYSQLHPGNYSWTIQGAPGLITVPASGSFSIQSDQNTNIGRIIFYKSGPGVVFNPNPCNSAVCSAGPGADADLKSGGSPSASSTGTLPGLTAATKSSSSSPGMPALDATPCVTNPTTPDLVTTASRLKAEPGFILSSATAGAQPAATPIGGGPVTTPVCNSPVDITMVNTIDFNGGFGAPDPNNPGSSLPDSTVPTSNTTVQFSGVLYAEVDGNYQFQTTTNGPVTLTVNNSSLIDSWTDTQQTQAGQIYLTGGHQYNFTMNYAYDSATTAAVTLAWQQPTDSSINPINSIYYATNSTLVPLQDWVLNGNGQTDNYTTASPGGQLDAADAGYTFTRTEGCAYEYQLPSTVPLNVYYNGTDYFTTSTDLSQQPNGLGAYTLVGTAGYIFPTPLTDGSSIPLQTWNGANDNYAAASQAGIAAAQQAGYVFLQTEGYVLPATSCQ